MDEKDLGKKLQLARKRAGLTQQELCQKAGLSYSTLAKIERGAIRSPSVFTVAAIADATNTNLEDLLGLTGRNGGSPALPDAKKRSKTGVTFVYFDINGTLVRFFHKAFAGISRVSGKPTDFIETIYWRYNTAANTGQMSLDDFNALLGKELGLEGFNWQKYYLESVEPMPGIKEILEWAAKHYQVGILSNNMPGFIEALSNKGLIPDIDYTAIVDSSKVGAVKPQPKIFEVGQAMAAADANEILLIDNERPNLTAADRVGWQVQWFDDMEPQQSIDRVKKFLEF